jgi:tRNA synthetases class I (I, L, M and V)
MLTDQWYVNAQELAKPAIASVREGRTKLVPENWDKTYYQWMENIQPWCISRQLWWGHQIPAWYGQRMVDGGGRLGEMETFCALTEEEVLEQAKKYYPNDYTIEIDNDPLDTDVYSDNISRGLLAFSHITNMPLLSSVNLRSVSQSPKISERINSGEKKIIILRRDPDVLRPLALLHARLAGRDARTQEILPDGRSRHRL